MQREILLDMDGVLTDFHGGAMELFNKYFNLHHTVEAYARDYHDWDIARYYKISDGTFWKIIELQPHFWFNLKPLPWFKELHMGLSQFGRVTILTSPSLDPICAMEKIQWLKYHMNITADQVIMGSRKEIMAGKGFLVDDSPANIERFTGNGGEGVCIPSTWNTQNLCFSKVWATIREVLK